MHLRRRVVEILDDVHRVGRYQRKIRLQLAHFARAGVTPESPNASALLPRMLAEQRIAAEFAVHSAALVRVGTELLELSVWIDASTTPAERLDLLGAGRRRGVILHPNMPFAAMLGAALEQPKDKRGRGMAGPLYIACAAACSANMTRNAEGERHAAERVAAAGWVHAAPSAVQ